MYGKHAGNMWETCGKILKHICDYANKTYDDLRMKHGGQCSGTKHLTYEHGD